MGVPDTAWSLGSLSSPYTQDLRNFVLLTFVRFRFNAMLFFSSGFPSK